MGVKIFKADADRTFTVKTVSGTVYKLSTPDSRGYRTIRRMMAGREQFAEGGFDEGDAAAQGVQACAQDFFQGEGDGADFGREAACDRDIRREPDADKRARVRDRGLETQPSRV